MSGKIGRNNTLTSIGGKLRAQGLEEEQMYARLLQEPARDSLPEAEVRAIARSMARKPAGRRVKTPETGWPSPLHQLAAIRGWEVEALQALGASDGKKGREVQFPMRDAVGKIIGHRRRRADNNRFRSGTKAMTVKGSRNGLIMPWPFPVEGSVLVVEGEADACAALSAGWKAAIATPSAQPGVRVIESIQKVLAGRAVVLAPDPDGAGEHWRDKIGSALHSAQCTVRVIIPLPDQDLDKRLSRLPDAEREAWLKKQVEEAVEWKSSPYSSKGSVRHIIRLGTDEGRVNDQVLAALANDMEVFSRGGKLVQVVPSSLSSHK
jgi:5S rRNA maturation endonuclease (ribonuclease M5)